MNEQQLALDLTLKLSDRQKAAKVLGIIRRHVGRANAVSMHSIADAVGISARDVQAIVKFLVEERECAIGTSTARPFGYYSIRGLAELETNYRHFIRRGLSNIKHARAYMKPATLGPIVGQLEIEAGDDDNDGGKV